MVELSIEPTIEVKLEPTGELTIEFMIELTSELTIGRLITIELTIEVTIESRSPAIGTKRVTSRRLFDDHPTAIWVGTFLMLWAIHFNQFGKMCCALPYNRSEL